MADVTYSRNSYVASTRLYLGVSKGALYRWLSWIVPALVVVFWQIASRVGLIAPQVLPAPSSVAATALDLARHGDLFVHLGVSLLRAAAARVAHGGRLIIRTGLQDDSWRFRITVAGDWLAKLTLWMKSAPVCYPERALFESVLGEAGLKVRLLPLWGGTPFNNHLIVAERE